VHISYFVFHVLAILLWQNGYVVLDHEDERLLGLHLLQFPEVGHVNSLCCFWALDLCILVVIFITCYPGSIFFKLKSWNIMIKISWDISAYHLIIQEDTLTHIWALCIVLFFRFLRRHAAIYCLVCCVITSIPWQKSLQKSSILIVRYTSETALCLVYQKKSILQKPSYYAIYSNFYGFSIPISQWRGLQKASW
jgi:hypothetical protein